MSTKPWEPRWKTLERLGHGGRSEVYRVQDSGDEARIGALKVLKRPKDPSHRERMVREERILRAKNISGVPRVLDSNCERPEQTEKLFIVIELIEGSTLEAYLGTRKSLDLKSAVALTMALVRIVRDLDAAGVGHRDIKPDNVILRNDDPTTPVLIDFGQAFDDDEVVPMATADELGNRFFRLPELTAGDRRSFKSDPAFCVAILFYALTGIVPQGPDDGTGLQPHERPTASGILSAIPEPERSRLRILFSSGLSAAISARYTIERLANALDELLSPKPRFCPLFIYRWTLWIRLRPVRLIAPALRLAMVFGSRTSERMNRRIEVEQRAQRIFLAATEALEKDPTEAVAWLKRMPLNASWGGAVRLVTEDACARGVALRKVAADARGGGSSFRLKVNGPADRCVLVDAFGGWSKAVDLKSGESRQLSGLAAFEYVGGGNVQIEAFRNGNVNWPLHKESDATRDFAQIWASQDTVMLLERWGKSLWRAGLDGSRMEPVRDPAGITGIVPSPTRRWLAMVEHQRKVTRVRFEFGSDPEELADFEDEIVALAISNSGTYVAVADSRGRLHVWHEGGVAQLGIASGEGVRALFVADDGRVRWVRVNGFLGTFDARSQNPPAEENVRIALGHSGRAVFSEDGQRVAISDSDGAAIVFDLASGAFQRLSGHPVSIEGMAFSGAGEYLVTADFRREVRVWNLRLNDRAYAFQTDLQQVVRSPDRRLLVVATTNGIAVLDPKSGATTAVSAGSRVSHPVWSGDGKRVVFCQDGEVREWDRRTNTVARIVEGVGDSVDYLSISRNRRSIVWGTRERGLWLWHAGRAQKMVSRDGEWIRDAAFEGRDGLVAGTQDGRLIRWREPAATPVEELFDKDDPLFIVQVAADGVTVAVGSENGVVRVSDLTGVRVLTRTAMPASVRALGKFLVWVEMDRSVRVFDGVSARRFGPAKDTVYSVEVDDVRGIVAAACEAGKIYMWDLNQRSRRPRIISYGTEVHSPMFLAGRQFSVGGRKYVIVREEYLGAEVAGIASELQQLTQTRALEDDPSKMDVEW